MLYSGLWKLGTAYQFILVDHPADGPIWLENYLCMIDNEK